MDNQKTVICQICKKEKSIKDVTPGDIIRISMVSMIKKAYPDFDNNGFICKNDLNSIRAKYVEGLFDKESGELSDIEKQVVENIKDQEIITKSLHDQSNESSSKWDVVSDKIATFGGSWKFIVFLFAFLAAWMILNAVLYSSGKAWDSYPYVFLNFILACIASIQAPIIIMSQNKQEKRDRIRSDSEYQINLKSEIGIRNLNEKMDHMLFKQWEKNKEIQTLMLEIMQDLHENLHPKKTEEIKK